MFQAQQKCLIFLLSLKFYAKIYLGFTDSHKCAGLAAERVDPSSPGGSVLKTKMKQITKFEPK